ncbi:MAG TPA: cytochrome c [Longimicrobiales bacterium]
MTRACLRLGALLAVAGCTGAQMGVFWQLERMLVQPRYVPYRESRFFPDGRVMQPPPGGTVPRGAVVDRPAVTDGRIDGRYLDRIPIPVTLPLLATGRAAFNRTCAACHGILGDGASAVARNMELRPPPSLHTPRIRAYPPGRIYATIREGYGLMPSYAAVLSTEERWAVVAYVRALQLSQYAPLAALPPDIRAAALRALAPAATPGLEGPDG